MRTVFRLTTLRINPAFVGRPVIDQVPDNCRHIITEVANTNADITFCRRCYTVIGLVDLRCDGVTAASQGECEHTTVEDEDAFYEARRGGEIYATIRYCIDCHLVTELRGPRVPEVSDPLTAVHDEHDHELRFEPGTTELCKVTDDRNLRSRFHSCDRGVWQCPCGFNMCHACLGQFARTPLATVTASAEIASPL